MLYVEKHNKIAIKVYTNLGMTITDKKYIEKDFYF